MFEMSLALVLTVILIFLTVINVIFHSVGILLLLRLSKDGRDTVQNIYITNLSVTELVFNAVVLLDRFSKLFPRSAQIAGVVNEVHYYILIVVFTGIVLVYYLLMFYITLDKAMEVLLNLKYCVYWSENKAKCLVKWTWVLGLATSSIFSLSYAFKRFRFQIVFSIFVYPILNFIFMIVAVVMYGYIFHRYRQSRLLPMGQGTRSVDSLLTVFRRSRFYITVCLIFSFLTFMVLPSMLFVFYGVVKREDLCPTGMLLIWICYGTSTLIDVFIYVFMMKPLRKLLWKMLRLPSIDISNTLKKHAITGINAVHPIIEGRLRRRESIYGSTRSCIPMIDIASDKDKKDCTN